MTALGDFKKGLVSLIGKPTDLRPFVCDGSPLNCKVFIVGFNPATDTSADFWDFWNSDDGFDKSAWRAAYWRERQNLPNTTSRSRSVIDLIVEEANPVKILETNIYAKATKRAVDLPSKQRLTAPFDFLIESIQPRVIVAHGKKAQEYLEGKYPKANVIAVKHFSRGFSYSCARSLGQQIRCEHGA